MTPRVRQGLLAAGLIGAGLLAVFGDKTPVDAPVEAVQAVRPRPAPAAQPSARTEEAVLAPGQVRPMRSRAGWFAAASGGRDIFSTAEPAHELPAAEPPPPPPPPEVPLRLIGRLHEDGRWSYFLEGDNTVRVLRSGQPAKDYRLDAESPQSIRVTRLSDRSHFVIAIDGDKH